MSDILVIEDEKVVTAGLRKICECNNLSIDAVETVSQGLARLVKQEYRLILCDIMLPDMDGFQFLQKQKDLGDSTPVIIMTGYTTSDNAVMALQKGAIDFLPKPFTMDEVLDILHRGLRFSELVTTSLAERIGINPMENCQESMYRLGLMSWLNIESPGQVSVGVTDIFLQSIEGVEEIVLLHTEKINQGNIYANLISKSGLTHRVLSPISGLVCEINRKLLDNAQSLNTDPCGDGWIIRVVPSCLELDLESLIPCRHPHPLK